MIRLLSVGVFLFAGSVEAQVYKCVVNGKSVYSDVPCAANARYVGEMHDHVSEDQQVQRLEQSIKERRQRNTIEGRESVEAASRQRAAAAQMAADASQARAAEANRRSRCAGLEYDIKSNQRGTARYRDFGWQQQLTQQENELKANRESYDRDCR